MKMLSFVIFIFISGFFSVMGNEFYSKRVFGETMTDSGLKLDLKKLEPKSGADVDIQTESQTNQQFDNIPKESSTLSYSISSSFIDYGTLFPGEPIIRTNQLSVDATSANYQVVAWENHPIQDDNQKLQIPDTTCDNGSCSEVTASVWENPLVYGFGYRCDNLVGFSCTTDTNSIKTTKDKNSFKQFSNIENLEKPQIIMKGDSDKNDKVELTYKLNIPNTQFKGVYQNNIIFIILPRL